MARITYADKEQHHASPLPDEQKWMHGDANEVKESVNAIYDADQTTGGRLMLVADAPEGQVGSSPDLTAADNELNIGAEHGHGIVNLGNGGGSGSVSAIGVLNLEGGEVEVSGGSTVRLSTSGTVHVEIDENGALLVANEPGTSGQVLTSNGADNPPYWAEPDTDITPFLSIQSGSMSGTLREDGTNAGKAKFALVGGDPNLDLVAWSGSAWMVTVGGVVRYTSASDVATPDLATGWTATGGAQPLPVFSPVYGPTVQDALEQITYAFAPRERVWEGYMTQDGTDLPTVEVLRNTLGGTPVFTYVGPGVYTATLEGAFPLNKTSWFLGSGGGDGVIELGRCITIIPNGVGGNELSVSSGVIGSGEYTNGIYGAYFKITVKRP